MVVGVLGMELLLRRDLGMGPRSSPVCRRSTRTALTREAMSGFISSFLARSAAAAMPQFGWCPMQKYPTTGVSFSNRTLINSIPTFRHQMVVAESSSALAATSAGMSRMSSEDHQMPRASSGTFVSATRNFDSSAVITFTGKREGHRFKSIGTFKVCAQMLGSINDLEGYYLNFERTL